MSKPPLNAALANKLEAERKLKEGISGHKTGLPKKLLELFEPLPPLASLNDIPKRPPKLPYIGIAQYVDLFAAPGDEEYEPPPEVPRPPSPRRFRNPEMTAQARVDYETKAEKKTRVSTEKIASAKEGIDEGLKIWDPAKDPLAEGDPFKTLFVARVSYDATEKKLKREFEEYGPVKRVRLVTEKDSGKPRGYAFIEFEHKNDMKTAYKMADGHKIEGRRVIVDVERGRTVPNWQPRRLGGGKGGESREPKAPKDPSKRGLLPAPPSAAAALPPPPIVDRDRDRERDREREKERERDREKEREKERERERERAKERAPERSRERDRERERDVVGTPREKERERDRTRDARPEKEREGRDRDRKREREDGERDRDHDRKRERRDENGGDRKHDKAKEEREEGEHRSSRRKEGERREDGERRRDDDKDRHRERDDRSKRHREEGRSHKRERDLV